MDSVGKSSEKKKQDHPRDVTSDDLGRKCKKIIKWSNGPFFWERSPDNPVYVYLIHNGRTDNTVLYILYKYKHFFELINLYFFIFF